MVYDNTIGLPEFHGIAGFAIHDITREMAVKLDERRYSLYTDDGRGNGDFICDSDDIYWIRRIAYSLDEVGAAVFNASGQWIDDRD